jgi:hypothetical protein
LLKISPTHLKRLTDAKKIFCERDSNGDRLFYKPELERFAKARRK